MAKFTPTVSTRVPAPDVTSFSSSGPDPFSNGDLLKPDIVAPGSLIAAGTVPGGCSDGRPIGRVEADLATPFDYGKFSPCHPRRRPGPGLRIHLGGLDRVPVRALPPGGCREKMRAG